MQLPRELRDMVYELLSGTESRQIRFGDGKQCRSKVEQSSCSVLFVSRPVHREAMEASQREAEIVLELGAPHIDALSSKYYSWLYQASTVKNQKRVRKSRSTDCNNCKETFWDTFFPYRHCRMILWPALELQWFQNERSELHAMVLILSWELVADKPTRSMQIDLQGCCPEKLCGPRDEGILPLDQHEQSLKVLATMHMDGRWHLVFDPSPFEAVCTRHGRVQGEDAAMLFYLGLTDSYDDGVTLVRSLTQE